MNVEGVRVNMEAYLRPKMRYLWGYCAEEILRIEGVNENKGGSTDELKKKWARLSLGEQAKVAEFFGTNIGDKDLSFGAVYLGRVMGLFFSSDTNMFFDRVEELPGDRRWAGSDSAKEMVRLVVEEAAREIENDYQIDPRGVVHRGSFGSKGSEIATMALKSGMINKELVAGIIKSGAGGVEFDVVSGGTGIPVVCHDSKGADFSSADTLSEFLEYLCNDERLFEKEKGWSRKKRLRAGREFRFVVHIKTDSPVAIERMIALFRKHNLLERVVLNIDSKQKLAAVDKVVGNDDEGPSYMYFPLPVPFLNHDFLNHWDEEVREMLDRNRGGVTLAVPPKLFWRGFLDWIGNRYLGVGAGFDVGMINSPAELGRVERVIEAKGYVLGLFVTSVVRTLREIE